ncbi:style cell-cycle inhibitor 1-B isoform 2 [Nicotiana tabacum]|uniref:Style cell-cycle inhibitor 1-B n=1 Tax=Nicotiana tabacum TaxID=4097 RepID=SCI1B_TOBAC|nr:style cell-cycle inhibitor 1-B isoform 2 [Nicotiana tabacum]A0A1S3XQD6.2 RecName: Full=Style cell-cycle inhibitor 1-B; Short=NtSCI1 [Nicotiana tabacum]
MGSDKKTTEEKRKHKRNSPSSPRDEVKSKRQNIKGDEERRKEKDKSKKEKHKSHKSKCHSSEEKKSGEKHKTKSHKHKDKSKNKFEELSKDDYFSKNNEFASWLKDKKNLFFSDLSSETARNLFSDFVIQWNKGKLDSQYYEGIATGPRSSHAWNIKK